MSRDLVELCFLNNHFLEIQLHNSLSLSETRINLDEISVKLGPSILHQEVSLTVLSSKAINHSFSTLVKPEQDFLDKWEKVCKPYEQTANWKGLIVNTVSMMDDYDQSANRNLVQ